VTTPKKTQNALLYFPAAAKKKDVVTKCLCIWSSFSQSLMSY